MALQITFRQGAAQSYDAGRYFNDLADELVTSFIGSMTPRQYLVVNEGSAPVSLRIWSVNSWLEEYNKDEALGWLRSIMSDVESLEGDPVGPEELRLILDRWLSPQDTTANFFLEKFRVGQAFRSDEMPELSVGVLGGRTVMLSAPRVMYVRMEPQLYGLSIAGSGSFLMEELQGEPVVQEHQRRA